GAHGEGLEDPRGGVLQALALLLPASTAYVTPPAMEFRTALSSAEDAPPPRLMFATAGATKLAVTQFTPAMTPEMVPEPWQSRTRTATSATPLATPEVAPPTMPDTCVPCPLQSSLPRPSLIAVKPWKALPPKSTW